MGFILPLSGDTGICMHAAYILTLYVTLIAHDGMPLPYMVIGKYDTAVANSSMANMSARVCWYSAISMPQPEGRDKVHLRK